MDDDKEKKRNGRPMKATAQELELIIQFFFSKYPEAIGERNIAARLERFVKEENLTVESGKPLLATDFRRDVSKAIIKKLVQKRDEGVQKVTIPALEPLDIEKVVSASLRRQVEILQQRELFYQNLHARASMAIELWMAESAKRDSRERKLRETEQELEQQKAECRLLKNANLELEKENRKLRGYLKDDLASERAKVFYENLQKKEKDGTAFEETAVLDIRAFIQEDARKQTSPSNKCF